MRLTVGPLAPAVYWRRRAVVAAIVALAVVSVVLAIEAIASDGGHSKRLAPATKREARAASKTAGSPPVSPSQSETSSPTGPVESRPDFSSPDPSYSPGASVLLGDDGHVRPCSDQDIALTAGIAPGRHVLGGTFPLSLTIRNISPTECKRDIGSGPQEVRVLRQNNVIWSSNDCGAPAESDVRTFPAGAGVRFTVQWNSFRHAPQACQVAAEAVPEGTYQVVARLAEKVSDPVTFDIVR